MSKRAVKERVVITQYVDGGWKMEKFLDGSRMACETSGTMDLLQLVDRIMAYRDIMLVRTMGGRNEKTSAIPTFEKTVTTTPTH